MAAGKGNNKIEEVRKQKMARYRKVNDCIRDRRYFSLVFMDDAVFLTPGQPPVVGRDAISDFIREHYESGQLGHIDFEKPNIQLYDNDTVCKYWVLFDMYNKNRDKCISGKGHVIWRKQAETGEWFIQTDMFNESR